MIMKKKYTNKLLAIFLSCFALAANATNYVVHSAEELANLGSLSAGDTVKMAEGIWLDENLLFTGTGTASKNIVLTVDKKDATILSGSSTLNIFGEYLHVDGLRFEDGALSEGSHVVAFRQSGTKYANNCRISNTTIKNYNPTDKNVDYKWLSIYGKNNRVDHCYLDNKEHSGTTMIVWLDKTNPELSRDNKIDHNYFGHRPDLGYNGGETIRIGDSESSMQDASTIVEYNLFEECDGEIEIISNKSCFNVYRYNTFTNNDGCLTLRHGNDCEVYGNYFYGGSKSSGGVRIIGERHKVYNNYFENLQGDTYRSAIAIMNGVPNSPLNRYFQVQEAQVINNTIVNCKMPICIGAGKSSELSLPPLNCKIANNAVDKTSSGRVNIKFVDTPINMFWEGNIINAEDEQQQEGVVYTNPQLVYENNMWRPDDGSPLIDASIDNYIFIIQDIEQQERSGLKDIGCDEKSSEETSWKPLTTEDVGPYSGEEERDPDTSIRDLKKVKDMVSVAQRNDRFTFFVQNPSYGIVKYSLSDISGRLVNKGSFNESETVHLKRNAMYVVVFESDFNKSMQVNKLMAL